MTCIVLTLAGRRDEGQGHGKRGMEERASREVPRVQAPDAHGVVFWDAGCGMRESDHQSLAIRQWQSVRQSVVVILTFREGELRTVGKGLRATRRSRLCVGVQGW